MPSESGPTSSSCSQQHLNLSTLGEESFTAYRLTHSSQEHLHTTSRCCFIGPIPAGWLKTHRRDWYRHHLFHVAYSSRAATFAANADVSRQRRLTGLEGPSAAARFGQSFPQPGDLVDEDELESEDDRDTGDRVGPAVSTNLPPSVPIARSEEVGQEGPDATAAELIQIRDQPVETTQRGESLQSTLGNSRPLERRRSSRRPMPKAIRSTSSASFKTAHEFSTIDPESIEESEARQRRDSAAERRDDAPGSASSGSPEVSQLDSAPTQGSITDLGGQDSLASLIPNNTNSQGEVGQASKGFGVKGMFSKARSDPAGRPSEPSSSTAANQPSGNTPDNLSRAATTFKRNVQFNIPEDSKRAELQAKARLAQANLKQKSKTILQKDITDGMVVKMERMLVRVDATVSQLPEDFDENDDQKTIVRNLEKWREYMVVCRESKELKEGFLLQMYTSRVIPAIDAARTKKRSKYEIPLKGRTTRINLYSSLDKSIVLWTPFKKGNKIFILRPRSGPNAMEWYTFIRNVLGWKRAEELSVQVPDLGVTLRINNPFQSLEASRDLAQAADGDDEALLKTMEEEQAVARRIIEHCMETLNKSTEHHDVMETWNKSERMGLAWKRYDRLEWIHGISERRMYGTIGMQKSHELQLRPKFHYPTKVEKPKGVEFAEPSPVEGFLIRLTSQRGIDQKMGKLFYKRLYYSTYDRFLVFTNPSKAVPPPPPRLPTSEDSRVPTAEQIVEKIPIIYAVNPYPIKDGKITWLQQDSSAVSEEHDTDAHDEAERRTHNMLACEGYLDLSQVLKIRSMQKGAHPVDDNLDEGSDVDFDAGQPSSDDAEGRTGQLDGERTFELVLRNGLIVRLQCYDTQTKREWLRRLRALAHYWSRRSAADTDLLLQVRAQNLAQLHIDEQAEAEVGQTAKKWEVVQSYASSQLYNLCSIASCRTIHLAGELYYRPTRRAAFAAINVILTQGKLLLFRRTLRNRAGNALPSTHHDRVGVVDLAGCYLYSGYLTEGDLLYRNQTFDPNRPGHTALPRIYLEDGWSSTDEDVMCTFVLWQSRSSSLFRAPASSSASSAAPAHSPPSSHALKRSGTTGTAVSAAGRGGRTTRARLRFVSSLGKTGRGVVFKARSRAERDHWVMGLGMEMERAVERARASGGSGAERAAGGAEDVRVVG